jgi:hypothetical protein
MLQTLAVEGWKVCFRSIRVVYLLNMMLVVTGLHSILQEFSYLLHLSF